MSAIFIPEDLALPSFWLPAPRANRPTVRRTEKRSDLCLDESQQGKLAHLMQAVKPTSVRGQYTGAMMSWGRTQLSAAMSGDYNDVHMNPEKPHPRFGRPIAHGMDTVTQAFAAVKHETAGTGLFPSEATIEFKHPVYIGEDHLSIHVGRPDTGVREVEVFAQRKGSTAKTLVVKIELILRTNPFFDERTWFCNLMAGWRISALLAASWPGCLYLRQTLFFGKPLSGKNLVVRLKGETDGEKASVVSTEANGTGWTLPFVTGKATIMLPA